MIGSVLHCNWSKFPIDFLSSDCLHEAQTLSFAVDNEWADADLESGADFAHSRHERFESRFDHDVSQLFPGWMTNEPDDSRSL